MRERAARGVDVVKVMASGGNLDADRWVPTSRSSAGPSSPPPSRRPTACGLPLAVHAHGTQAVLDAIDVGADSIEHCTLFTADGVDTDADLLARIAAGGSVISATAAVLPGAPVIHEAIRIRLEAILANFGTLHARRPPGLQQRRRHRPDQAPRRAAPRRDRVPSPTSA